MTARAQALGLMLEEEEGGEGEEKISGARRLRAVTAVAVEWQRWQALEAEVRRAADEVLHASRAWRVAEGRYEAAVKAAERAEERECEAQSLADSARRDKLPRRAIADRRLRRATDAALKACSFANAAGGDADAAADAYDARNADLEDAEVRADVAHVRLRAAEQEAAWYRAVAVLARLRAAKRRPREVEEEHDMVLVVDEEEVFVVPDDPVGVAADDDLPPLLDFFWCQACQDLENRVVVVPAVLDEEEEEPQQQRSDRNQSINHNDGILERGDCAHHRRFSAPLQDNARAQLPARRQGHTARCAALRRAIILTSIPRVCNVQRRPMRTHVIPTCVCARAARRRRRRRRRRHRHRRRRRRRRPRNCIVTLVMVQITRFGLWL
eukprot:COSAG05_NODE_435_length_9845_cov_24.433364_10_plen_383_part_00